MTGRIFFGIAALVILEGCGAGAPKHKSTDPENSIRPPVSSPKDPPKITPEQRRRALEESFKKANIELRMSGQSSFLASEETLSKLEVILKNTSGYIKKISVIEGRWDQEDYDCGDKHLYVDTRKDIAELENEAKLISEIGVMEMNLGGMSLCTKVPLQGSIIIFRSIVNHKEILDKKVVSKIEIETMLSDQIFKYNSKNSLISVSSKGFDADNIYDFMKVANKAVNIRNITGVDLSFDYTGERSHTVARVVDQLNRNIDSIGCVSNLINQIDIPSFILVDAPISFQSKNMYLRSIVRDEDLASFCSFKKKLDEFKHISSISGTIMSIRFSKRCLTLLNEESEYISSKKDVNTLYFQASSNGSCSGISAISDDGTKMTIQ